MKRIFTLLASFVALLTSSCGASQGAKVASPYAAPDAEGLDQQGSAVKFAEVYKANDFVVVYFYPKADTPGCTKQSCSLRDAHADLTAKGVKVIGVSHDSVAAQKAFTDKYTLPFTLIADAEAKVSKLFKVEANMLGMASRQCFLIHKGLVVWHDPKASTGTQADDLRAVLKEMGK
jgi:thioredoxin-dependent peroxiredoxin